MSDAPLIRIASLSKHYGAPSALRLSRLDVRAADRITLAGLDAGAAEALMHLVTGAVLPDEGDVHIDGRPTRDIETDSAWLESLDRFGMVTERSVLFEELPVAASLALPLSLSIDPMPPEVRARVDALARIAGLASSRLEARASSLTRAERWHVHLARALAHGPRLLLLERPLVGIASTAERQAFARSLRRAADEEGCGWLAVADDPVFDRAAGSRRLVVSDGRVREARRWFRPWRRQVS